MGKWEGDSDEDADQDKDTGSCAESAQRPDPSVSPERMIKLSEVALKRPGWADDKVADQFPRASSMATSRMAPPKMDSVDSCVDGNPAKGWWISKSLRYDFEPEVLTKRTKLG